MRSAPGIPYWATAATAGASRSAFTVSISWSAPFVKQACAWRNLGEEQAHIRVEWAPALRTEILFETFFGLARDGKTNRRGLPNLLRLAVILQEYDQEIGLARPAPGVQRVMFWPLALLGRRLGYRGWYPGVQPRATPKGTARRLTFERTWHSAVPVRVPIARREGCPDERRANALSSACPGDNPHFRDARALAGPVFSGSPAAAGQVCHSAGCRRGFGADLPWLTKRLVPPVGTERVGESAHERGWMR
jgi:hypothetical protein